MKNDKKGILGQSTTLIAMVVIRAVTMLFAFKFLSNYFGASGLGQLSQVMAVAALFSTFAGGGLSNGLVKEVAGANDADDKTSWLKAGLLFSFVSSAGLLLVSLSLFLWGAPLIFGDAKLSWIFLIIGVAQIFTAMGSTAQAYLSGMRDIRSVALAGIIGALVSVFSIITLSFVFGFNGAIFGCAVLALCPSLFAIVFLLKKHALKISDLLYFRFDKVRMKLLAHYSLAMLITASAVPIALIFMRLRLSQHESWDVVGHWQAVSRIGDAYIQVFGVLFISIILPKLANLNGQENFVATLRFIPPVMTLFLCGAFVFWIFSPTILTLAYSSSFGASNNYVLPQLIADFFKILSSFLVYRFVAIGRPYLQAVGELVQAIAMLLTFLVLLPWIGGPAAVWSYVIGAATALIYTLAMTAIDGSHRQVS